MEMTFDACSLDREGQAKRLSEIATFGSQALLSSTATPRGVLLRLENDEATRARLWNLIDAEKRCCPFLHFEVRISDEEIWLEVSGLPETRSKLHELLGLKAAIA